jgi:hypothetical protein
MPSWPIYKGEITLTLNEGNHAYGLSYTDAKPDGCTTIAKSFKNADPLIQWSANQCAEAFTKAYVDRLESGDDVADQTWFLSLKDDARYAWRSARDTAGDVGREVHALCQDHLDGKEVELPPDTDQRVMKGYQAFLTWRQDHSIEGHFRTERGVFSKQYFFAGCADFIGTIDGEFCILDFKTGSGVWEDAYLQIAGYAVALEEELERDIKRGWIIHLNKKTGKCVPHKVDITPELKGTFVDTLKAYKGMKAVKEMVRNG